MRLEEKIMIPVVAISPSSWRKKPTSATEGVEVHLDHRFPTLAIMLARNHVPQPSDHFRLTPEELDGVVVVEFSRPVYICDRTDLNRLFAEVAERF